MNLTLNLPSSSSQGRCFRIYRQQQQLERVQKWLELRNRDTDHRSQVEERRRKREEEAKVIDASASRPLTYLFCARQR